MKQYTPAELLAFEEDIAQCFARGEIKAPIHLAGGNEQQLIDIFNYDIGPDDWCLCAWRAHYHCLLKGVPPQELKAAILAGRSISLAFPQHKMLCSGIVGGIAPIAVGIAYALKKASPNEDAPRVFAFVGDMTARTGIMRECMEYACGHDLPVTWVIEDNGKSVCTNTRESWGIQRPVISYPRVVEYEYELSRPHSGTGQWVRF